MKPIFKITSLFILALLICACSNDNEPSTANTINLSIEGNWELTEYYFSGSRRIVTDNDVELSSFSATSWDLDVQANFTSPDAFWVDGFFNLDHIYIDEDGNQYSYPEYAEIHDSGTYIRTGNVLRFEIDGEITQGTITRLTETDLQYRVSSSSSETNSSGTLISIERTDYFSFIKN